MRTVTKLLIVCALAGTSMQTLTAEKLVILHTNDTHSQIDPTDKDLGGVLRRKVLIDSIKANNRNTLLVDAGDAVQGTMFFNLFGGEVEYKMLDLLGYDMATMISTTARRSSPHCSKRAISNGCLPTTTPLKVRLPVYSSRM